MNDNKIFLRCEKCGKRLIERREDGLFYFVFGKKKTKEGTLYDYCPVQILIHGSIKMHCLSRDCDHWSIFNYFPEKEFKSVESPLCGVWVETTETESTELNKLSFPT